MRKYLLQISLLGGVAMLCSHSVWANDSCTAFLADKYDQAQAQGQWWHIQMTIHREDVPLVTYSDGFLSPNTDDTGLSGRSNQLFSDRFPQGGTQPFDLNSSDFLDLYMSSTALFRIHYHPWEFETTWDFSCNTGSVMVSYQPGFGLITVTFRELFTPIG